MKKLFNLSILILAIASLLTAGEAVKIRMEGSTTVLPIAQLAAEEFMIANPDVTISVQGGGSGVGIASLIDKTCDIATSSRAMKDEEIKNAVAKGVNPVAHIVAMDGIAVILHPSNKIKNLTVEQIRKIYTGKISNWKEVGGEDKKIVVLSRDTASGTFEAFSKLALNDEKVRKDALMNASNQAIATTVEKTPGAIGYVGIGYISSKVKAVTVENVTCTKKNILTKTYPLSRPLFMYTNGKPKGVVKDFIDFILSEEGQELVETAGYVGLK
ncbi:MAG TPA: phosphate ABC transporter substrate-binding protein [Candidatus Marinimicrobia bacterium]|nr:phosphate ABC transporter substrate-binding protein [Candidatus Neomarinimicrobiota bacterium]HQO73852.1 phosphate ABC transporter substrate-binding protein [Candidatus Neomarinimicrobiota bacterium]HQQ84652.1 phosphate ABC transporter substrate-binding protein [Candidatus Neomarinimicrobiota bacterium]